MNNIMLTPEQSEDDNDYDEFDDVSNNSDSDMNIDRSRETYEKEQSVRLRSE